jgi:predicted aconitase
VALSLNKEDQSYLAGRCGAPLQFAMQLLVNVANVSGATRLIDVSQAHLVGSYYSGPADMALIHQLAENNAQVKIPTTLSASSTDREQPTLYPPDQLEIKEACRLIDRYQQMGCTIALTCAPYHLPTEPQLGDNIAWAESNAVLYANSVIGARTNKTYQYLDLAAALTGRIPDSGLYLEHNRRGQRRYFFHGIPSHWFEDDSFYQLLGLYIGGEAGQQIPVINGLPAATSNTTLRNLGSAMACAGNFAMLHAVGLTPEANTEAEALHNKPATATITIGTDVILAAKRRLTTAISGPLTTICMGTPHFSLDEFEQLLKLLANRRIDAKITLYISTSRHVLKQLTPISLAQLQHDNIHIVADTCTYYGHLLNNKRGIVMTCSAKWAYYAPSNLGTAVVFARMTDCIESAVAGKVLIDESFWQV